MLEQPHTLTVSALTKYIKRKFDADPHLREVHVKGEISNFKKHSSGHMYFTLKDEKARILAVMFTSYSRSLKFIPENGMKVIVTGEVSVYESSGQYQMYIKEMTPDGIGNLFLAYEQLKQKLDKEGLFSAQTKKQIPLFPTTIGVITSPTGAAVRDVITTIKRRFPIAKILVFPALVQGENGAPSVVSAIKRANKMSEIDVLIVGRGGGSIEELWVFNEESVARAIFDSDIPIISAVGHETDFTIADFVADLRAPTPTGAAELAVPHIDELMDKVLQRQTRLLRGMKEILRFGQGRLERLEKSYAFRYPRRLYEQKLEQLDILTESLIKGAGYLTTLKKNNQEILARRLQAKHPTQKLAEANKRWDRVHHEMQQRMIKILTKKQHEYDLKIGTLQALSPLKIMQRGYSLVYDGDGELVKSVKTIQPNEIIQIQLKDGSLRTKVEEIKKGE